MRSSSPGLRGFSFVALLGLSAGLLRCIGTDVPGALDVPADGAVDQAAPREDPVTSTDAAVEAAVADATVDAATPPGTIDPGFPIKVWQFPNGGTFTPRDVAVDAQGRILVAGGVTQTSCSGSVYEVFGLVRVAAGALDNGFGTNGGVCHHAGNIQSARAIGLVQDRIVVAGTRADELDTAPEPSERGAGFLHIARFSPNGTIETVTSFVNQPDTFQAGMHYSPRRVTVDDDGILVSGEGFDPLGAANARGFVQKVQVSGNGYTPAWSYVAKDVFRISGAERTGAGDIVSGTSLRATSDFVVRRLARATGDLSASGSGKASIAVATNTLARAAAAFATPSGGVVVVGGRNLDAAGKGTGLVAVRFTAAGILDTTFGSGGVVTLDDVTWEERLGGEPAALDTKGRIVVLAGRAGVPTLVRLRSDGVLDATFGSGGHVALPVPALDAGVVGIAGAVDVDPRDDAPVAMLPAPGGGVVLVRVLP